MTERARSIAVALATYHRPANLVRLVPSILEQFDDVARTFEERAEFRVIIVDNDPQGSGRETALATGDSRVTYVIESSPGVTSARNRALREAGDCDFLVFIDDDEIPQDGWLVNLLTAQKRYRADVVSGPVHSVFEGPLDPWVEASDAYLRAHRADTKTGEPIKRAATNNLLLDMRRLREFGVTFDERFGLTGGEDSFFTGQLHQAGAKMVWCAEAVVDDLVPLSRANRDYNLRRRYSLSNASGRVDILLASRGLPRVRRRVVCAARGVGQILYGAALTASGVVGRSLKRRAYGERFVVGGAGALAASLAVAAEPYRR
ncbi:glycosyltransferase [Propioniciclava soli]|uniref:Glycosyltransferase n=1 Tax=Propioniciclava soli TaxID=2775081 RepID=A0ABZ3C9U9_9ACTN